MMADNAGATLLEKKDEPPKTPDKKKTKYDVIIIGAGPAGYTAGIYCSRARHDTLILSGILPGGQLVNTTYVENYPGFENGIMGPDLMITMRNQTKRMGTTLANFVKNVASSIAESPPPATTNSRFLKKGPSHVAQYETPLPAKVASPSNPSFFGVAPVAMMTAFASYSSDAVNTFNG